jgi:hypothetical protein
MKSRVRSFNKLVALLTAVFAVSLLLTGCSQRSPETQELHLDGRNGVLAISWFAKDTNLDSAVEYSGMVKFGSFEYEFVGHRIEEVKGAKDGLQKFKYVVSSGEIIYSTHKSVVDFDSVHVSISTFDILSDNPQKEDYLEATLAIPKESPSFDGSYLWDEPWVDEISVDFHAQNAWHFPETYTCTLMGDLTITTVVQYTGIFSEGDVIPCRFTYDGVDGMVVSVAISASNQYGNSPIYSSEPYTLTTFVSDVAPEQPECPDSLSTTELQAKPGQCGTFNVEVFQADLDTGSCTFLGNWPQATGEMAVGIFNFCDVFREGAFTEGLTYTVSAKVLGTASYTARIGGERTVVEFELVK